MALPPANRLHSAAIHLLRRLRTRDVATGLTAPRASILSVLVFGGRATMTQLAEAEQVRLPTMSRLVGQLERDGLVTRTVDPDDRRVHWLAATPRARSLLPLGRTRRVAALEQAIRRLPKRDRQRLVEALPVLERVVRAISRSD